MTVEHGEPGGRPSARADRSDLVSGALAVLVGLAVIPYARSMPEISEGLPGPGLFPGIVGGLFVLFGTALVIKALVVARRGGVPGGAGDGAPTAAPERAAVPATGAEPAGVGVEPVAAGETGIVHDSLAATGRARWINAAVVLGAIVFYIVAAELFGFLITMFVLMAVIMLVLRSRVLVAVLTAAGVTALLYAVFELGLLVQLPDGILG